MKNFLLLLLLFPTACFSQAWSGVLDPSRAMDWTKAGADSTIVNETRIQCGTTISPLGTSGSPAASTTINTAISNCAASHPLSGIGGYVQLGAGSFFLNTAITHANNVTLRGAGANNTTIFFSGAAQSCAMSDGCWVKVDSASSNGVGFDGTADNFASWTGGYAQGTTSITINTFTKGSRNNWLVGSLIFLDQLDTANNPVPATGLEICRDGACGGSNVTGRPGRSLTEPQVITSISGTGPWTVGITPGIRTPNWFTAGKTPQVWGNTGLPIQRVGIENIRIDNSNGTNNFGTVECFGCYNVWVKGVAFTHTVFTESGVNGFYHFRPVQSMRVSFLDSYVYGSPPVSNYYAMSCWTSADELFQNNITQHVAFSFMHEGCVGSVSAYNFAIDDVYTHCHGCSLDVQWQQSSSQRHGGTDALGLFEGNVGIGATGDEVFGASDLFTLFRNFYNGRDPNGGSVGGKTEQTNAVLLYPPNRYWNVVGNVMGTAGYHTTYQCASPIPATCNNDVQIYSLGYANGYSSADDAYTTTSMMRWGNYDTVNNAVRFVNAEVPSGLVDGFANPVPGNQVLPPSFYLAAKPAWWGLIPWPAIGPDVTGGNITSGSGAASTLGGHANFNPAATCYLTTMNGPTNGAATLLSFNPAACYATVGPNVTITPLILTFNSQPSIPSAPLTVTVLSSGGTTLVLNTPFFTITGANAGDFTRSGGTCTDGQSLLVGQSCTISLVFTPSALGTRTGTLNINGNASGTVSLIGNSANLPAPITYLFARASM